MTAKNPAPSRLDVRMPADLRTKLETDAARSHRSTNQQAVYYIQEGMRLDAQKEEALERIEQKLDRILALLEKK